VPKDAIDWTERLHAVVDELAAPLVEAHGARLRCRAGCAGCCADELTVFPIEAAVIARRHAELLATGTPHEAGACAFLDAEGRCRVYDARPYVCRTQGLPLRWLDLDEAGAPVETRDVCPLNVEGGPPVERLAPELCWTLGPIEQRLAQRQRDVDARRGGDDQVAEPRRVALRSLFASPPDAAGRDRKRLEVVR
jgi:hypothetical protein